MSDLRSLRPDVPNRRFLAPHRRAIVFLALALIVAAPVGLVASHQPAVGRVVVTVTTLDGSVHLPGVSVELRAVDERLAIARSVTDGTGQVEFPEIPPGQYIATASRPGFVARDSQPFTVIADDTAQVLLDTQLGLVMPEVEVRADMPSPTDSVQPVSMSDMLSGSIFESSPLPGDDFQSLLPLLPGVVRDADGRLRIRGGQPSQSALQVSSVSLIDPSTGDFDLDLPAQSVQSVEVLPNPFAAEYGRFSTSITQIRTRRGTNDWEVSTGNLVPRFRAMLRGIRGFEPRLSVRGPIKRDRLFLAQDLQFRYVATPVKSLPDEPETDLRSLDSFTRVDHIVSARHTLGGGVILFPRELRRVTMNTFRPIDTSPDFEQTGWTAGGVDRFAILPDLVVESALSVRRFEIDVFSRALSPMVYAPESQRGGFFTDQERDVTSVQWVESLSLSRRLGRGEHVIKVGTDLQASRYNGTFLSRQVEVRRLDDTLAELTVFAPPTVQDVHGTEFAVFAQDRWRVGSRVTFEFGLRVDRDAVVQRSNWSPRAGVAVSILPEGRGILRGGFGKFVQRTPLNIGAFPSFPVRSITRFAVDGRTPTQSFSLQNEAVGDLRTPEAYVSNLEWDQRFGRRFLLKLAALARNGSHEYIVQPEIAAGILRVDNRGTSKYRELETTMRYLGGDRRDLTFSYVHAHGMADLNHYDQFFGNIPAPLVRANEHNLSATDVPHRVILRGTIGLPGRWDFAPVFEWRSGFPWSAVDEYQDFVGPRNRSGRLPTVRTLDFTLARPWRFLRYRFRAGIKMYNVFGAAAERDVQANVTSPSYGRAFNPVERSFGIVLGTVR
jgi:hypothetical protein